MAALGVAVAGAATGRATGAVARGAGSATAFDVTLAFALGVARDARCASATNAATNTTAAPSASNHGATVRAVAPSVREFEGTAELGGGTAGARNLRSVTAVRLGSGAWRTSTVRISIVLWSETGGTVLGGAYRPPSLRAADSSPFSSSAPGASGAET